MCGIAGYIGTKEIPKNKIEKSLNIMRSRGPDNQDYIKFQNKKQSIYLLHSRLNIIDIDKRSNQPFRIGEYTLVFNGEIYNYIELKKILKQKKVKLKTNSDTEILLWFYIIFGENCLQYFEGMWSFAIYNNKTHKLFLSRDRFGEKPLYYYRNSTGLYFASEIKIIKQLIDKTFSINQNKIKDYLKFGYKSIYQNNETFFKDIKEFKKSSYLEITQNIKLNFVNFWKPKFKENKKISIKDSILFAREKLINSLNIRLRADVPIAFCLSGGIDSTSLASIAVKELNKNIKTFSIIDQDESYNEKSIINKTVKDLGCNHKFIYPAKKNFLNILDKMISNNHSPISTISYFLHNIMQEQISKSGFKVSLSGTGADELFSGYYSHFILHLINNKNDIIYPSLKKDFIKYVLPNVKNKIFKSEPKILNNKYLFNMTFDSDIAVSKYFKFEKQIKFNKKFTKLLMKNKMLNELFFEVIPSILHEDDHNSMCYSIENRSPFLDRNLFDTCYSIPTKYLIKEGYNKYILRKAMEGIVNQNVLKNRVKIGFNTSISQYIKKFNNEDKNKIFNKNSNIFEFVNLKQFKKIFEKKKITNSESKFIFNILNTQIFLEKFN